MATLVWALLHPAHVACKYMTCLLSCLAPSIYLRATKSAYPSHLIHVEVQLLSQRICATLIKPYKRRQRILLLSVDQLNYLRVESSACANGHPLLPDFCIVYVLRQWTEGFPYVANGAIHEVSVACIHAFIPPIDSELWDGLSFFPQGGFGVGMIHGLFLRAVVSGESRT